MAEIQSRSYKMDVESSHFQSASNDQGIRDNFLKFLSNVNLDDRWPLEGEFDTHLCLKCLTNVVGLAEYLVHKLRDCPKLKMLTVPSRQPEFAAISSVEISSPSELDDQHQQLIKPTEQVRVISSRSSHEQKNKLSDDDNTRQLLNIRVNLSDVTRNQGSDIPSSSTKREETSTLKSSEPYLQQQKKNAFCCEPCGLSYTSRISLVYHLASSEHWRTSRNDPAHEHLILTHSENLAPLAPYKCSICPYYFNRLDDLANHCVKEGEAHKKKLGPYRQLLCANCNFQCWSIEELLKHLDREIHIQNSPQNPVIVSSADDFLCRKCNFTCKRQHALLFHIKLKHSGELYCGECQLTFEEEEALNQHILEIEHEKNIYNCALCPFFARSKLSFEDHLKQGHHQNVQTRISGLKRILSMNVQKTSKTSDNDSSTNIVHQFMKTVDRVPQNTIIQVQNKQLPEETAPGSKSRGGPGPLTFAKADGNGNSENREPNLIFVPDSLKEEYKDVENSQQETSSEKSVAPQQQEAPFKQCLHCNLKFDNQKALKYHLTTLHRDKMSQCEPLFATFYSKMKLKSLMKGSQHVWNTKDAREEEKTIDVETEKEIENGLPFQLPNKDNDENIFISDSENGIYVHIINDINEHGVVVTSNEADNDDGLNEIVNTNSILLDVDVTDADTTVIENTKPMANGKCSNPPKLYRCSICQETVTASILRSHLISHTGEKLFSCSTCNAQFSSKAILDSHEMNKHGAKKHCYQERKIDEQLEIHEGEKHLQEIACKTCDVKFTSRSAAQSHMLIHAASRSKEKTVQCTFSGCTKLFRYPSEMLYHKRMHSDDVSHLCDVCGYATNSHKLLKKHERSHGEAKKFKCTYCSYAATHSYHLNRHMRIHCQVKPYLCPHCPFTCNSQANLRKHILNSVKHRGLKVYLCLHCDFGCNVAEEIKTHTIRLHSEIAKQYDTDNPGFASLVTGIFKPKADLKVPIEPPSPYVPVRKRHLLTFLKASQKRSKVDLNNDNSSDDNDQLQIQEAGAVEDTLEQEVDKAVENLIEINKPELETQENSITPTNIECSNDLSCADDDMLSKNVHHYRLFDDSDITFIKEEMVPMDLQEVTVWAVKE